MVMKKTSVPAAKMPVALTSTTGAALVPLADPAKALAKLPGTGGFIARERDVTLVTGRPYATREQTVPASEVYFVDDIKPSEDGPWLAEADKVAWRDSASGYECIMLRNRHGAFLSGYVGVPQDHPLCGWEHEAITPNLGVEVHGGLTYSRICEDGPSPSPDIATEARRICHLSVPRSPPKPLKYGSDYRVEDGAHAWWFGFDCNHIYDIVPKADRRRPQFLAAETAAVYRDDAYVVREITNLAAQLKAIAEGKPMPKRVGPPLPPIGLNPHKGG